MFNDAALYLIFNNEDTDVTATVVHHDKGIIMQIVEAKGFHYYTASDEESVEDHRRLPCQSWKKYNHEWALWCIRASHLTQNALYASKFVSMFWISWTHFEHLMSAVMSANLPFYKHAENCHRGMVASLESWLPLPLKTLAHGVSSHVLMDYFQHLTLRT